MSQDSSKIEASVHQHQHQHKHHFHSHGHSHSHDNGNNQEEIDLWAGKDYLDMPGVFEVAHISHDSIIHSLKNAGINKDEYKNWDILEIGCGAGAVTKHFINTFKSVHAIDTSPTMIATLSEYLKEDPNMDKLTYFLHTLSSSSNKQFEERQAQKSPIKDDLDRMIKPKQSKFKLAISNLVLHHIDNIPEFLNGAISLLEKDGWLVFTEIGWGENENLHQHQHHHDHNHNHNQVPSKPSIETEGKPHEGGSFNAPDHYRKPYTVESLKELFEGYGLKDVYAEERGVLPVFGVDNDKPKPSCLIVRGRKV
ncbi:uncharacterized protein L201_007450 [Kwoniella dendrophila CBS 6074]|uniref:Methyltransferase type 12 domain-containing protein n=1 Tax=Kwoniella dendrophila CBS 6074 TaxID=1295534 RepID=A0AAX4K436_9TREE